jgi:hypothetical protein
MNVYQQEILDEAISGLTEYYPVLKLPAVRARVGNGVKVPETNDRQVDYISVRDQIENDLIENTDKDTALLIIDNYDNGKCPDCDWKIRKDVVEGGECRNCGHVFYSSNED